jgi:hypothetical protein
MNQRIVCAALVVCGVAAAPAAPKGTVPRSGAERYSVHATRDGVGVGVVLLTAGQARKAFVSDVNRCCVVVEVALYPGNKQALEVSLNHLVLRVKGTETAAKPASAKVVAATLQKKAGTDHDVTVFPTVGVGVASGGYGPAGQPGGGGVYKQVGVGVAIGGNGPQPGSTDQDRAAMEVELAEKGLPEGSATSPVSGFVYFPLASRKKGTTLQLECDLNGSKVTLALPWQ